MSNKEEFLPIKLIKAIRRKDEEANYLIYKNKTEFVSVKANSVFEAILNSGIEEPFKVIPLAFNTNSFLEEEELKFVVEASAKIEAALVQDKAIDTPNLPEPSQPDIESQNSSDDKK